LEGGGQNTEYRIQKTEDRRQETGKFEIRSTIRQNDGGQEYETNTKRKCSNEQNGEVQR